MSDHTESQKIRRKIKSIAGKNGGGIAAAGLLGVVYGIWQGDVFGTLAGCGVLLSGWNEWRARKYLDTDIDAARNALRLSQVTLFLIIAMATLSGIHGLNSIDPLDYISEEMRTAILGNPGVDLAALRELSQRALFYTYLGTIILSLCYQGGLFWYYSHRTAQLKEAIKSENTGDILSEFSA